jgi:hypothetical protein
VVAVDGPQQRGFAGAIGAVHHPAFARADFQVDAAQDVHVVDVHVARRSSTSSGDAAPAGRAPARGTAALPGAAARAPSRRASRRDR